MKRIQQITLVFLAVIGFSTTAFTQELNCEVQVNSSQITGSDKSVFDVMQKAVFEFMNNRIWTNHVYDNNERIECTILINITEQKAVGSFAATLQVQSRRPIFNTSYYSPVINHIDRDFDFAFNEFDQLDYSETTFQSNLTGVLAFYAYMIIAMDYESFSDKGGEEYLKKAQNIVNNAQGTAFSGWKAFEGTKNRYWMVENLLKPNYVPYRETIYNYHRMGFDIMATETAKGRSAVVESIKKLKSVFDYDRNSFQLQLFFNAKKDELISLLKEAPSGEKNDVVQLMKEINPGNASDYDEILKR